MMLKYIRRGVCYCLLLGLFLSCKEDASSFVIVLNDITDNLGASVCLSATVKSGTNDLQEAGFIVSTSESNINIYDKNVVKVRSSEVIKGNKFLLNVSDLDPKTDYYYRAYAKGENGLTYSNVGSFTTVNDSVLASPYETKFLIGNGEIVPNIRSRRYWQLDLFSGYNFYDSLQWWNLMEVLTTPMEGYGIFIDADDKSRFIISPKIKMSSKIEELSFFYLGHPFGTNSDSTRLKLYVTNDYELLGRPVFSFNLGESSAYLIRQKVSAVDFPQGAYVVWEIVSGVALLADISIKPVMTVKGMQFAPPGLYMQRERLEVDLEKIPLLKQR